MNQQLDLLSLEKKRLRKLKALLLGLLLEYDNEEELYSNYREQIYLIRQEILDIDKASYEIADKYSKERHLVKKDKKKSLLKLAASLYLLSYIIKKIFVSNKQTYVNKVRDAINTSKPILNRVVITEIYSSNLIKMIVNNQKFRLKWNAVNDSRICSRCEELDGQIFDSDKVPEYVHINCRCLVEVVD